MAVPQNFFDKNSPDECAQFLRDCGLSENMIIGCMARALLQMTQNRLNEVGVPDGFEHFAIGLHQVLQTTKS